MVQPALAPPLPVILAGGRSRRYGSPKALARIGGAALLERVREALAEAAGPPVLVTADPALARAAGLPSRPDLIAGGGPAAGLHAALAWAEEEGRRGALVAACDMPFLSAALLRRLIAVSREPPPALAVAPASAGRHGAEPLCAWYSVAALPAVERAARAGGARLVELLGELDARLLPLDEVRAYGDPDALFLNVNTPADRERAERIEQQREDAHARE